MFINTVVDFQDLKSTCDQSYMRNCDFEHFVSTHFGHSYQALPSSIKSLSSSYQVLIKKFSHNNS